MRRISPIAFLITVFGGGGCPGIFEDEPSLRLTDVSNGHAVLQYYTRYSGFETLPSTVWDVDLDSAQTQKVRNARRRFDLQVSGDFYVAEVPDDDDLDGSLVVGGRFSAKREFTVARRNVRLSGRYDRAVALDGSRAVVRTAGGLLVYDLAAESAQNTVEVTDPVAVIHAVGGDHALVVRGSVHSGEVVLVNLSSSAINIPPTVPDGLEPNYFDAVIRDGVVYTGAIRFDSHPAPTQAAIVRFDIEQSAWSVLAVFELDEQSFVSGGVTVDDVSDEYVLAHSLDYATQLDLILIDRRTGECSAIPNPALIPVGCSRVIRGGTIYWVESTTNQRNSDWSLTAYDIAAGTKKSRTLTFPAD